MTASWGTSGYIKATQVVGKGVFQDRMLDKWPGPRWEPGMLAKEAEMCLQVQDPRKGEKSETGDGGTPGEANAIGLGKRWPGSKCKRRRGKHSQDMYLRHRVGRIGGLIMGDEV